MTSDLFHRLQLAFDRVEFIRTDHAAIPRYSVSRARSLSAGSFCPVTYAHALGPPDGAASTAITARLPQPPGYLWIEIRIRSAV